jgi:hypothetical protein
MEGDAMSEWPLDEIVEVEWGDAHQTPGWMHPDDQEEAMKPLATKSVGYIFQKTKEVIVLCDTQNKGQIAGSHTIPMGMVTKIRTLNGRRNER